MRNILRFSKFNERVITQADFTEMLGEIRQSCLNNRGVMPRGNFPRHGFPPPPPQGRHGFPPPPGNGFPPPPEGFVPPQTISMEDINQISNQYGVYFIDYETFYQELSQELKHTAPPRNTPLFGFLDPNNNIKIVVNIPFIGIRELPFIKHICEHESVHREQWRKRGNNIEWTLPNANVPKEYFSNKDEIMAFSQSIVEMITNSMTLRPPGTLKGLINELEYNDLWKTIKRSVSEDVKNRYLKYITQYFQNYLSQQTK